MKTSRRQFVQLTLGFAASLAFFNLISLLPKRDLVRPPGAVEEDAFLSRCIRCGICVDVCPTSGLSLATMDDGIVNVGTPKLTGHCKINCLKCTEVCPTGALQKITVEEKDTGTAVINKQTCLRRRGGACRRCVNACPVEAISLSNGGLVVDEEKCVGCAICTSVCPTDPPSIIVIPEGAKRIKINR